MKQLMTMLLILAAATTFGQQHLEGQKTLDLYLGTTVPGVYVESNFGYLLTSDSYLKFGAAFEYGELTSVNYKSLIVNAGYYHVLYSLNQRYFFKAGAGITANTDFLGGNLLEGQDEPQTTYVNYGGFVGIEIDAFVSDRIALSLSTRQNILAQKEPGNLVWFGGLGAKYVIF